jgi:glucose dehydrogenase
MNLTIICASGARSWVIACALTSALLPLVARAADWQMSGDDLTNDRNQAHETLIDVGNVATLKPVWTFKTLGSVSATPLVIGGYVYVPDWGGGLHKLNARTGKALEHFPKRLNRGIPLRERIGFKVRAGMEASMDGETVFGGSACARCWDGTEWRYHPGNCGATWSEYQLCRALP